MLVVKRDGTREEFSLDKLNMSIARVFGEPEVAANVEAHINEHPSEFITSVDISKLVMEHLDAGAAKLYKQSREQRDANREKGGYVFNNLRTLTQISSSEDTSMRENANINADTAMGMMLKAGADTMKHYYLTEVIDPEIAQAHKDGHIHIHDLDFYGMTATCLQINLEKLFESGFSTGHGTVRTPQSIRNYWSLLCIIIQANQNDMHGGQAIPALEYYLAPGVAKSFARILANIVIDGINMRSTYGMNSARRFRDAAMERIYSKYKTLLEPAPLKEICELCKEYYSAYPSEAQISSAVLQTVDECLQGAEACIHNLCTMASRAGAQVPFSSINYGTGTSQEQRIVISTILQALSNGLGHGETQIFPIHIFKVKEGVNYNPGDPNYDLFKKAIEVTAKRMFPNFEFLDAPFNLQYYKAGDPDTEVATMGCRTRVMGNINGPETTSGRGNLSFTTINLPHLALEAKGNLDEFWQLLDHYIALCVKQLIERFDLQVHRHTYNFPMLFGNHMYMDSDNLTDENTLYKALRHGTLSVGFVGLAEALVALTGKHHGESEEAQALGLKIIKHMRELMDEATKQHKLNFTLLATPAESTAGTLLKKDRKVFGIVPGVTDKEYYTNSNHIPVWFDISARRKIELEAPYHAYCNAGHITYVEYGGDPTQNLEAMESIVHWMHDANVGYGAINRAIDTCQVCGYSGIFDKQCPQCGNHDDSKILRLRRVTGYLVGDRNKRFNDAKKAEEHDRVKHSV